jgi:hypothetical protein
MKNLYNTTEAVGVHKWMRELNVDVGFEAKKMKMERTRMLSLEGYHRRLVVSINGGSTISVSPRKIVEPPLIETSACRLDISLDKSSSASLLISVINFSIFFRCHLPLPRKRTHIEKYYPFPKYKIKPTNGSEYTKFHFDCHIICLPLQNRCRLQCLVNS